MLLKILENGEASRGEVVNADALNFLTRDSKPFDLIFLDPPYRKGLLPKVLDLIMEKQLLTPHGLIYLEHEAEESFDWSVWGLDIKKQSKAGQVMGYLLEPIAASWTVDAGGFGPY